jgi:hypothetical protein
MAWVTKQKLLGASNDFEFRGQRNPPECLVGVCLVLRTTYGRPTGRRLFPRLHIECES